MTTTSTTVLIGAEELAARLADPDLVGGRGGRQLHGLRRMAHRRRRALERLHRPQGHRLPHRRHDRAGGPAGPLGDRSGLDGRLLRLRPGVGLLATQVLRAHRRAHPGLLATGMADRWTPLEHDTPPAAGPRRYRLGEPDPRLRATDASVRSAIGDPGTTLLDVRSRPEYDGERFWPSGGMDPGGRAGHVPDRDPPADRRPVRRARGFPARGRAAPPCSPRSISTAPAS